LRSVSREVGAMLYDIPPERTSKSGLLVLLVNLYLDREVGDFLHSLSLRLACSISFVNHHNEALVPENVK